MKPNWKFAVFVALGLMTVAFGGDWGWSSGGGHQGKTSANCGTIIGTVGRLAAWQESTTQGGRRQTTGKVGADWQGNSWPLCYGEMKIMENTVEHTYTRKVDEELSNPFFHFSQTSTITASGTGTRLVDTDPEWWWDTAATVIEHRPVVQVLADGSEQWVDLAIIFDNDAQARASAADGPQNNRPDPNNPNGEISDFSISPESVAQGNTSGKAATGPDLAKLRILTVFHSMGGPSTGDNTIVNEKLELSFTLQSWFAGE